MGAGRHGLRQQGAVHVRVSARLVHDEPAVVVEVVARVAALGEHVGAREPAEAAAEDAERLAGRVVLHAPDLQPARHARRLR